MKIPSPFLLNISSQFTFPSGTDSFGTSATWSLEVPAGSSSKLTDVQGGSNSFTADIRGIYRPHYNVRVTGLGNAFNANSSGGIVVAADEWTETFESGSLNGNINIDWATSGDMPWKISEFKPHAGSYSVESGAMSDNQNSILQVNITVPIDGEISFAYKVSSQIGDSLHFLIDDIVVKSRNAYPYWEIATVPVTAGNHTLSWVYKKDDYGSGGEFDKAWIDNIFFPPNSTLTSIENEEIVATEYKLKQNYPNPFNPSTNIEFRIADFGYVSLKVFDVLGREVATLVNEEKPAGVYKVTFSAEGGSASGGDARSLSSGVYFYKLETSKFIETKKMLLMK